MDATPSLQRAVFLLSNCILGSGILGQAYAMRHSGWAVFVVSLLLMSSVAAYGAWLLLCCCETSGVTSYEEIGTAAYGKWGKGIATAAILIQNASAMTSYLVILGDLLPTLVREAAGLPVAAEPTDPIWANRAALMTVVAVVVIIPLVSLRNIGTLGYSSGLSIAIMVFFAIVAIVTAFNGLPCPLPADRLPATLTPTTECEIEPVSIGLDTFYVLPSLAFSFVCHTGLLPIYTELRRRDRPTMMRVAGVSMASCLALYLIAGEPTVTRESPSNHGPDHGRAARCRAPLRTIKSLSRLSRPPIASWPVCPLCSVRSHFRLRRVPGLHRVGRAQEHDGSSAGRRARHRGPCARLRIGHCHGAFD